MSFLEHLGITGSFAKARRAYIRERRWFAEDWYLAWQTTDLPDQVEKAAISWADRNT